MSEVEQEQLLCHIILFRTAKEYQKNRRINHNKAMIVHNKYY